MGDTLLAFPPPSSSRDSSHQPRHPHRQVLSASAGGHRVDTNLSTPGEPQSQLVSASENKAMGYHNRYYDITTPPSSLFHLTLPSRQLPKKRRSVSQDSGSSVAATAEDSSKGRLLYSAAVAKRGRSINFDIVEFTQPSHYFLVEITLLSGGGEKKTISVTVLEVSCIEPV